MSYSSRSAKVVAMTNVTQECAVNVEILCKFVVNVQSVKQGVFAEELAQGMCVDIQREIVSAMTRTKSFVKPKNGYVYRVEDL